MNIKLHYQYRDAGNYKNFSEAVFRNDADLPLESVDQIIRECLLEGLWFVADQWKLPDLHFREFAWNSELDHDWHEYEGLEMTEESSTQEEDITAFLKRIQALER